MPSITVTVTPDGVPVPAEPATVSHTSHDEEDGVAGLNADGAPGMPTIGPRGMLAIWPDRTRCGLSGRPVISRAEARFNAGYSLSPTRTYSAPESRSAMIGDSLIWPDGLMNE